METARSQKCLLYSCYQAFFHWEGISTFSGGKKKQPNQKKKPNKQKKNTNQTQVLWIYDFWFLSTVRLQIAYLLLAAASCLVWCFVLYFFFFKQSSLCIFYYHLQWHFLPKGCSQKERNILLPYEVILVKGIFTSSGASMVAGVISNWLSLNVWKIMGEKCSASSTLVFTGSYHYILLLINNMPEWNKPKKSYKKSSTFKLSEFN